jgi:Family of unknown function (DUF6515)
MSIRSRKVRLALLAAAGVLLGVQALSAQQWHGGPPPGHYDARYGHNHYYSPAGGFVRVVPGAPYAVGGGRYYFSGGVWYAPRPGGFVVVGAPLGYYVPVLPPFYTTVWLGGLPYYYANDTYYTWDAAQNGYEVVAPPQGADAANAANTQPPPSDDLFIYPQNGQTADQQANDKYECHKWSFSQTGYDPTQPSGGVAPANAASARDSYQRAMRACLEGRGYSVR